MDGSKKKENIRTLYTHTHTIYKYVEEKKMVINFPTIEANPRWIDPYPIET